MSIDHFIAAVILAIMVQQKSSRTMLNYINDLKIIQKSEKEAVTSVDTFLF
jgi:hypothetical protein